MKLVGSGFSTGTKDAVAMLSGNIGKEGPGC